VTRFRFSVNIPNFGDFADAETVAKAASATEAAGWDARLEPVLRRIEAGPPAL
jgi:hypothetical protein